MNTIEAGTFGEIITSLAITAGVLYLTYWTTRKLARQVQKTAPNRVLHIVEKIQLARDRQIAVLKVGESHFLVGITAHQIQFSQPIDYPSTVAATTTPDNTTGPDAAGAERFFTKWLNRLK